MKKAPTILQVVPWLDSGGVERGTVDIAQAIVSAGGEALVAAEPGRLVSQLNNVGGHLLSFEGRSKNPAKILLSNANKLADMIRERHVDLVHARSRAPAWSALIAARRVGVPFVTTYHGAYSQRGPVKAFYNAVMAKGDVVIANSDYTARLVAERNPDAKERIQSIYRGVDMAVFDPASVNATRMADLKSAWGVKDGPLIILPSRLTRWKGQSFILPVMGALKKAGLAFQLMLIGDDQGRESYVAELDRLIAKHDLTDHALRVGYCSDMPAAYKLADLTLVPSQDAETFGRSAAESLAMGTPVLVGDLGAQPEVTAPPEGVEPAHWIARSLTHNNSEAWQAAIALQLGQKRQMQKKANAKSGSDLAAQARAHIEHRFSLTSMGKQTLGVYNQLLGAKAFRG